MQHREKLSSTIQIRLLNTSEMDTYFHLNAQAFRPAENTDEVAARRGRYIVRDPDFHLHQLRGAFLGDTCVGGYMLLQRAMSLGAARLRTACISGVLTHPDYWHQGIASELMHDAIRLAESRQYDLLLLDGLGNFYEQFGYIDVLEDMPRQFILDRAKLAELTAEPCTVRIATHEDAPALLACYQRHYGSYLGSFAPQRSLQRQEHLLANHPERDYQPLAAFNAEQELQGYLLISRTRGRLYVREVATESWPATLALLQAHARLLDAEPRQELSWHIPPHDPTFYFLAEHLPLRGELLAYPDGGWMARPAHLPTLLQSLLPLWQTYWQKRPHQMAWNGLIKLTIDGYTKFLEIKPTDIRIIDGSFPSAPEIMFSSRMFTQLIFGFRPLSWFLLQSGQRLSGELIEVLNVIFPLGQAWIAGSDHF
jgi:predicted N-acetyltransferase YhbS